MTAIFYRSSVKKIALQKNQDLWTMQNISVHVVNVIRGHFEYPPPCGQLW